jgi:hypothetical protein
MNITISIDTMKQRTIRGHCDKIWKSLTLIKHLEKQGDPNNQLPSIKEKADKRIALVQTLLHGVKF